MAKKKVLDIDLTLIDPPADVNRLEVSEVRVSELARSIEKNGLLQPIKVHLKDGRYQIVFGYRRFLAHKSLNRKTIECYVGSGDDRRVKIERIIENVQSVDLTPLEEALQYKAILDDGEFSLDDLSRETGKSGGTIKRALNILDMDDLIKQALHSGRMSKGVAEELSSCPDASHRSYLAEMAIEHGITVAVARMWVNDFRKSLRSSAVDGEGGGHPAFTPSQEVYFTSCYLCHGPEDISKATQISVCQVCLAKLQEILQ